MNAEVIEGLKRNREHYALCAAARDGNKGAIRRLFRMHRNHLRTSATKAIRWARSGETCWGAA